MSTIVVAIHSTTINTKLLIFQAFCDLLHGLVVILGNRVMLLHGKKLVNSNSIRIAQKALKVDERYAINSKCFIYDFDVFYNKLELTQHRQEPGLGIEPKFFASVSIC